MAQYDVYRNGDVATSGEIPYILDLQHTIHDRLKSRLVVPLTATLKPILRLTPIFDIEGQSVVMSTMETVSVPVEIAGDWVTNLETDRSKIIGAVDFLFNGF